MRVLCFVALLLAGTVSVQAQAVKKHRATVAAAGVISPTKIFKHIDSITVPERDSIEFATQLLSEPFRFPNTQLETVSWAGLEGWADDDHAAAFATFIKSCGVIVSGTPAKRAGQPFYVALQSTCRRALKTPPHDGASARIFFERNFRPMRISPLGEQAGFLTGYYEPVIEGSRVPNAEFNVPLYRTPPTNRHLERATIESGALAGRKLEICWLKDPTDLFFAQIQGSARVKLIDDGKILRLNYSSHNGWPYTAIGGILINREIVPREEMSMDRIREWIEANPKEGKQLRWRNKSYVFFRETGLSEHEEPVGAQGISLTPGRTIAVDRNIHIYGTPFFIQADLPFDNENSENKFQRLMISQDTGGAIRGVARADLYFGAGSGAAHVAGRIRHPGYFTIFIPREIDPVIAGRNTPLPRPRPASGDVNDKVEVATQKAPSEIASPEQTSAETSAPDQNIEINAERRPEQTQ